MAEQEMVDLPRGALRIAWVNRGARAADKPVLVFLHDALGAIESWKDFPAQLCRAAELPGLLYDRFGHGESAPRPTPPGRDYLEEDTDELVALLDQQKIESAVLIGHSDGGSIALLAAARQDPRIKGVVAIGARIYVEPEGAGGNPIARMHREYAQDGLREVLARFHGDKTDDVFNGWHDLWTSPDFADWSIRDRLEKIDCAAFVIQGEGDEFASPQHMYDIADAIPGFIEHWLVPDAENEPHLEVEDLVLERIVEFIEREIA
jgi:pimeloyl-ACP methyl ester carboxylesterase